MDSIIQKYKLIPDENIVCYKGRKIKDQHKIGAKVPGQVEVDALL